MNFNFTEEQYLLRDSIRDLLKDRWSLHRLRTVVTSGNGFDQQLWQEIAGLGYLSLLVPEEYGGAGMSFVDTVLVFEELGRNLVPGPVLETTVASEVIVRFGTDSQKAGILPALVEGRLKMSLAIHEHGAGYDLDEIKLTATPDLGGYRLNGKKLLVPFANLVDQILVACRLGEGGPLALLLCDPKAEGVQVRTMQAIDPTYRLCEVTFTNALIPADGVLGGGPDTGAIERMFDTSAAAASAMMTGIAAQTLEMAVSYAKERTQFDRPIGSFQAVKHKCADMLMAVETSRSAVYYSAWALSEGETEGRLAVSMAKAYVGDAQRAVCNDSLQIHGGIGFTWEHDLHFFLKRGKYLEYAYGDAAWHRERVATVVCRSEGMS